MISKQITLWFVHDLQQCYLSFIKKKKTNLLHVTEFSQEANFISLVSAHFNCNHLEQYLFESITHLSLVE